MMFDLTLILSGTWNSSLSLEATLKKKKQNVNENFTDTVRVKMQYEVLSNYVNKFKWLCYIEIKT